MTQMRPMTPMMQYVNVIGRQCRPNWTIKNYSQCFKCPCRNPWINPVNEDLLFERSVKVLDYILSI